VSFIDGILSALGIGGGSLNHIKAMANSIEPAEMEHMAQVFEQGSQLFNQGHSQLESAIDNVVTGWKGEAATAASTQVLNSAMTSRTSAEASTTSADNVRQFVAEVKQAQAKIAAVQPVDTSFSTAVRDAGGPAVLVLNPGAVAATMAAAEIKSEQHREQAAGYLDQLNASGEQFAARQSQVYPALAASDHGSSADMPARLSIQPISSGGGGGAMPGVPTTAGGPGGGPGSPSRPPGTATITAAHGPKGGPGTHAPATTGPGSTTGPGTVVAAPPPGTSTTPQGTGTSTGSGPGSTPVAFPDPVGSGSGGAGIGAGTVALVGGSAAAIAAGGLSGLTRGGAAAGAGAPGGTGEDGLSERGAGTRGLGRSIGSGSAADDPLDGRLRGGLNSGAGYDAADEAQLRAGRMSAAAASELAAGERGGMMPGMGAGAGRRSDDQELDKRPDYLVETDDVWGDGRLAAPPVLG